MVSTQIQKLAWDSREGCPCLDWPQHSLNGTVAPRMVDYSHAVEFYQSTKKEALALVRLTYVTKHGNMW